MAYRRGGQKTYGDPNRPMTSGTRDFLADLLQTRDVDEDLRLIIEKQMANGLKQGSASGYITLLKQLPEIPREDAPTVEGYYLHNGEIYKVARAKAGHLYALERDEEGRFKELARGMMRKLAATDIMSAKQIKSAGL